MHLHTHLRSRKSRQLLPLTLQASSRIQGFRTLDGSLAFAAARVCGTHTHVFRMCVHGFLWPVSDC